jgi:hypothetical protein
VDLTRSDTGYRWRLTSSGVRVLAPPAHVPCAPSASAAPLYVSAAWSRGRHAVRVLRRDPAQAARPVGSLQKRSLPDGVYIAALRLARCGDRTRITYVITTGGRTERTSFSVARATRRGRAHR